MKISEMSEDEAKQHLYDCYMAAHDAIANGGAEGPHPSKDVTRWRAAAAGAPVTASVEKAEDDEQPELTAGGNSGNGGPVPGKDSHLGVYVRGLDHAVRFVPHGGQMLPGDVRVAMPDAVSTTAASTKRMSAAIPGYKRLA
jgi:hypothetical protein